MKIKITCYLKNKYIEMIELKKMYFFLIEDIYI